MRGPWGIWRLGTYYMGGNGEGVSRKWEVKGRMLQPTRMAAKGCCEKWGEQRTASCSGLVSPPHASSQPANHRRDWQQQQRAGGRVQRAGGSDEGWGQCKSTAGVKRDEKGGCVLTSYPCTHHYTPPTPNPRARGPNLWRLSGEFKMGNPVMCWLTMGIHSEQCVAGWFHRCTNITEYTYGNLHDTAHYRSGLSSIAYSS